MELITEHILGRLIENGRLQRAWARPEDRLDFFPVVKLHTPDDARYTCLLTEVDLDNHDRAFGLCQLDDAPSLRYVSIAEIRLIKGEHGWEMTRDIWFAPNKELSVYAKIAQHYGNIFLT